ncbi:cucumber peeling cupredoxin-like [Momordica charantia]|uniref:Cucumber peeling cupredoxin-like n=1 Tax=Momordica charantia TaxID=3673 RepID=A0A6J1CPI9_MOMCH|nr:cucumber peeling cupredoxin-like [Momordica charantia]
MAARSKLAAVFVVLTVAGLLRCSAAATHSVGDSLGWTIPPNPSVYSDWASSKTFLVGDILVFNFTAGGHDVTEVRKAGFDSCSSSNSISVVRTSPARVTLAAAGDHHFICSFPGHCDAGQKLSVTVRAQSSQPPAGAPAPSPKPSTPVSPSPSPKSARPPKASSPTATPPPENAAAPPPETAPSTPTTAPPPPNSAHSLGGSGIFFSAVLAIFIALI